MYVYSCAKRAVCHATLPYTVLTMDFVSPLIPPRKPGCMEQTVLEKKETTSAKLDMPEL